MCFEGSLTGIQVKIDEAEGREKGKLGPGFYSFLPITGTDGSCMEGVAAL